MKPLTKDEKRRLRQDTRSYHVAAVLDKASSERLLRPLPTQFELRGQDGRVLVLTPAAPAAGSKTRR